MEPMYYIGLDVHKRTIGYCVKDGMVNDSTIFDGSFAFGCRHCKFVSK